jgi:hypothetical protein
MDPGRKARDDKRRAVWPMAAQAQRQGLPTQPVLLHRCAMRAGIEHVAVI